MGVGYSHGVYLPREFKLQWNYPFENVLLKNRGL